MVHGSNATSKHIDLLLIALKLIAGALEFACVLQFSIKMSNSRFTTISFN